MDLSKNNSLLTKEAINYIALTEKRKKVPVCEILEVLCVFTLFYHGNLREAGLRLLHHLGFSCFVNKLMIS